MRWHDLKILLYTIIIVIVMVAWFWLTNIHLPAEVASGRMSWCELARSFSSYTSRCVEELAAQDRYRQMMPR